MCKNKLCQAQRWAEGTLMFFCIWTIYSYLALTLHSLLTVVTEGSISMLWVLKKLQIPFTDHFLDPAVCKPFLRIRRMWQSYSNVYNATFATLHLRQKMSPAIYFGCMHLLYMSLSTKQTEL
ncbi:hypothetical protein O6H91_08G023500 [Diphasiastrum complanatum]|uniref:Uncharacterized protein n=1 Tax=Diphasiastrum complanatum TaxID=34168 RepID=A0ACC2CVP5_DIPCM|nr:hypothetical protein O6H91_08G023500 [Diphasiastrum complanatum]